MHQFEGSMMYKVAVSEWQTTRLSFRNLFFISLSTKNYQSSAATAT